MELDLLRKKAAAGILAGALAGGLGAPVPVEAQSPTPISTETALPAKLESIEGNPLVLQPGLTPELFSAVGGFQASLFDSETSRVITYEATPPEGTDGISPALTAGFASYFLPEGVALQADDFTWKKISTPESEEQGFYMSSSKASSPELDQIAVPGSFGAISVYGPEGIAENYIEFRIPNIEIPELAPFEDFQELITTTVSIPNGEYLSGGIDISLTDPSTQQSFIENYKFLITSNGVSAVVVMANRFGDIHLLETSVENLSATTGIDLKSELNPGE